MKRLLFITGIQIFPAQSGGQMRSSNLAKSLSRAGFEVYVYSYTGRKAEYLRLGRSSSQRISPTLVEYVDRSWLRAGFQFLTYFLRLPNLWFALPFSFLQCPRHLRQRIEWADVVLVDFPFHLHLLEKHLGTKPRVLNSHNVEHEIPYDSRVLSPAKVRKWIQTVESRAARHTELVLACGTADAQFYSTHTKVPVVQVPNALDPTADTQLPTATLTRDQLGLHRDDTVVLFTGSKYGPNREAVVALRAFVEKESEWLEHHHIVFLIVGSVTHPERKPAWMSTGFVEETQPYFRMADYAINPVTSGSGTNVKMFEYLVHRLPVLATSFGARGFDLEDGADFLEFDFGTLKSALTRMLGQRLEQKTQMGESAFRKNRHLCDMDEVVRRNILPALPALTTSRVYPTSAPGFLTMPLG